MAGWPAVHERLEDCSFVAGCDKPLSVKLSTQEIPKGPELFLKAFVAHHAVQDILRQTVIDMGKALFQVQGLGFRVVQG